MSVATCLGVDDVDGEVLTAARNAWPGWCDAEPGLGVVDDLLKLRSWIDAASHEEKNAVLVHLARVAGGDVAAAGALAWLLVPGAAVEADDLRDLSPDVDALVAGQLWLEVGNHGTTRSRALARVILLNTRKAVMAEFGVGDGARRRDRVWEQTTVVDRIDEYAQSAAHRGDEPDADMLLKRLIQQMMADDVLTPHEARMVFLAASSADWIAVARRGRCGITAPASFESQLRFRPKAGRTTRRHLAAILDKMADYAEHDFDPGEPASLTDGDERLDCGEYLLALGNPGTAQSLKRSHAVDALVWQCPGMDLPGRTTSQDQCSCARLKVGCLMEYTAPDKTA